MQSKSWPQVGRLSVIPKQNCAPRASFGFYVLALTACAREKNLNSLYYPGAAKEVLGSSLYRSQLGVGVDFAENKPFRRCVTTPTVTAHQTKISRLHSYLGMRERFDLNTALNSDASVGPAILGRAVAMNSGAWSLGIESFGETNA